jgi:hypothetical protein
VPGSREAIASTLKGDLDSKSARLFRVAGLDKTQKILLIVSGFGIQIMQIQPHLIATTVCGCIQVKLNSMTHTKKLMLVFPLESKS